MNIDVDYKMEGIVFNIQRFSLHDGPGIRTIVFLKGCPLSCWWCSNPESQKLKPVMMYLENQCVHCGRCISACPQGALSSDNPHFINRDRCIGCGECELVCPAGALSLKGKSMTVQQVLMELKKDASNYRHSGGGITLSGGEALMQPAFTAELLKACQLMGWHTAMETTGYTFKAEAIKEIFPYVDLVLLDVKSADSAIHLKYTGVTNEKIKENAAWITKLAKTVIRVPTIPGVNAWPEAIVAICDYAKTLTGIETIHLLPYHTYGANKYPLLGRDYKMEGVASPTEEEMAALQKVVEENGFRCVIGG